MRIALPPLGVYLARVAAMLGALAAYQWATGSRLDPVFALPCYGVLLVLSLALNATDFRIRRETGERAVLDLGTIVRSGGFWGVAALCGLGAALAALLIHAPNVSIPRVAIGMSIWSALLTASSRDRRTRPKIRLHPSITTPRQRS